MTCPYCAEEIQDAARLCRFCGARREVSGWQPPAQAGARRPPAKDRAAKGGLTAFTMKSAAVFILLSALFEVTALGDPIALLGAMRGGVIALAYHLTYIALFVAAGATLWIAHPKGPEAIYALTAAYTLDKLLYLLVDGTMTAEITHTLGDMSSIGTLFGEGMVEEILVIHALLITASWWGFALYVYLRRAYFDAPQ